jgi:subtilisin family serine protease
MTCTPRQVIVASGNSATNSCEVSPAKVAAALTISATDLPMSARYSRVNEALHLDTDLNGGAENFDTTYRYTNTGPCVDLWAPGVDVYSGTPLTAPI